MPADACAIAVSTIRVTSEIDRAGTSASWSDARGVVVGTTGGRSAGTSEEGILREDSAVDWAEFVGRFSSRSYPWYTAGLCKFESSLCFEQIMPSPQQPITMMPATAMVF